VDQNMSALAGAIDSDAMLFGFERIAITHAWALVGNELIEPFRNTRDAFFVLEPRALNGMTEFVTELITQRTKYTMVKVITVKGDLFGLGGVHFSTPQHRLIT
jgi:hypothetical protein